MEKVSLVNPTESTHLTDAQPESCFPSHPLFTNEAFDSIVKGEIPDFEDLSEDIIEVIRSVPAAENNKIPAIRFATALNRFELGDQDITDLMQHADAKHILIENDSMKMIMIRWEAGRSSSIHGHPKGGCVFKVLHGKITERRFSSDGEDRLLSKNEYYKGNVAYIDDVLGYHQVTNTGKDAAITIHLYTSLTS